jgi:hypothetical protein
MSLLRVVQHSERDKRPVRSGMDFQQRQQICDYIADYVGRVTLHLSKHIGEEAAFERVLAHLAIVLDSMFDEIPPEDAAWSLIPQPHDVTMPGSPAR